jgi:predicted Zn-dependent protease with MMP-like domain
MVQPEIDRVVRRRESRSVDRSQWRVPCRGDRFAPRSYAAFVFLVTNERFEELAAEALESLPESLSSHMDNVVILVEDEAPGRNLFGLYQGIPLTKRGVQSYSGVMPDRITLYQTTICRVCASEDDVKAQVRKTVIHEIAHHFGISDPRLDELGWA